MRTVRLQLGDVTFDSDARQLLRGRAEIHLSPKAFELLKTLIDHRPRAMSKNELHEHLWPATFVSDANLASLIGEIREALGDNAKHARFIRTAHRFGYAFSGEALEEGTATAPANLRVANDCAPSLGTIPFCWLVREGQRTPLSAGDNILGREPEDETVRIDSPTVSRRHARISISANGASLEDLDSKNGTFLRGKPVSAAVPLADGDEIRVGAVTLRFRMASTSHTATWDEPG
jgi:DNA-binding winged helix-turn-helix (wHTH) protein